MLPTITAAVYVGIPGAVRLNVISDAGLVASIVRQDAAAEAQPVRNFSGAPTGLETVVDAEAPLGRPVAYSLIDPSGAVLGTSNQVTVPALPSGRALLRSVLRPSVRWMEADPQDESGVQWSTSTTVHRVVGSDTPVVVGEVRQRRTGTMTFLASSTGEADALVRLCGDGTAVLLRFDPCASPQVRDLLFYPLDITERRWGRQGWRLVSVDYQATRFVPGMTDEPPLERWTFADLRDSATDFGALSGMFRSFGDMALNQRVRRR